MTTALDGGGTSSPPASKGKARMGAKAAAEVWTCGICLAKSREAIRGELDCCAHHFCFVCIMAWARVESRCPFCKARFRTIRRPPAPGRFPSERIVAVPERNQVYRPEGNASITTGVDPYANTICDICNFRENDELVILCDLCDSAAHTYCAGLGTVVPEGDWFCEDCAASKEEHAQRQADDEGLGESEISSDVPVAEAAASSPSTSGIVDEDHATSSGAQSSRVSTAEPVPSIYDIVGDDYTTNAGSIRLRSISEDSPSQGAPSAGSQSPQTARGRDNGLASYHALIREEIERTRAFRDSRNRDQRIRALRETWASLRDGSVGFSAIPKYQRFAVPTAVCSRNGASGTSSDRLSSASSSEEASTSLSHGNRTSQKETRDDVRKAWKMLEMARFSSERKASNKPSSVLNTSPPFSVGNRSTSYSPIDAIIGLRNQNRTKVPQKNNENCGRGTRMGNTPATEYSGRGRSLPESSRRLSAHERMVSFQDRINGEILNGEFAASNNCRHAGPKSEPLCGTDRSEKAKSDTLHPVKQFSLSSGQSTVTSLLQLGPSAESRSTTIEVRKSSWPDRHHERKRKLSSEECHDQTSKRSRSSCNIAKTEISSLAIRELKLLKIDKTYGSDRFKEVARTVTHTVLAACGFEHSPSLSLALSSPPVCEHSSGVKLLKSSVIANSCAECLRDSVKEATSLVLSGRQMDKTVVTS